MAKLLKTATLGCKVNQYETEFLRESLITAGYRNALSGESANLILVNTCSVTAESDLKSRKMIRRLSRLNPDAEIVVLGCYASRAPEDVARLPQVTEVITDKRTIGDFLKRRGVTEIPIGIRSFGERHRAYVKIQDGCRVGCAYCIIPKVRPYLLSRPADEILTEIRQLVDCGYREIVLTGIHLGHYGLDFQRNLGNSEETTQKQHLGKGNPRLYELVEKIVRNDGPFRLRISSMEAVEVSDELIELVRDRQEKICPHFHLSMQSGSDAVLKNMRRRWLSKPFLEKCEKITQTIDRVALTTDVIVGFPGETEKDFEETCRLVERIGFSKVHVFPFSPREGTIAATLPDQISPKIKAERAAHLTQLAEKPRHRYVASLVGTTLQVLFESANAVNLRGTADRYLHVNVTSSKKQVGQLVRVDIKESQGDELHGNISGIGNLE